METVIEGDYGFIAGNWPMDSDKPTLIFIHGAALSKGLWEFQVKGLSDIANTIAIDLPGHKDSTGKACDRMSDCAISVNKFIEQIQAPAPILCGLSMGGGVVLELLINEPDKYKAGILMHTGAKLKVMPFVFETIEKEFKQYVDLVVDFATAKKSDKTHLKNTLNDIAVTSSEIALMDFLACDGFDVLDRLEEINVPVMVVVGDEDNITPPKYGEFLHRNISNAKLETIIGAGHLSPIEKPEEINQLIRDYVSHC